ncbi:MAG: glycosyltransferase [Puia sp.]|nr:glycosyltransferase [Puia sp.]
MPALNHFGDITLLVTHYNRSKSLERLLHSFQKLGCSFGDIVVSDDASKPEHIDYLRKLQLTYPFRLITTSKNGGLGNNINKGQDAVATPYTFYVQEDFVPTDLFSASFRDAYSFMEKDSSLDLVRFYAYVLYPYLKPYGKGFSEIVCKIWQPDYMKIYAYSDHPHLRRSNFMTKFGRYKEGAIGDKTEYAMCVSFIQRGGKGLVFDEYKSLFIQENSSEEPSTMKRTSWKQKNNIFMRVVKTVYRTAKYNFDILFMRQTVGR